MHIKKYMLLFLLLSVVLFFSVMQKSMITRALITIPALLIYQGTLLLFLYEYDALRSFTWKIAKDKIDLQLSKDIQNREKKRLEEIEDLKKVKCMVIR